MQYIKIKETIVEQIDSGMLEPRQKLPPERRLAESFDTTRVTLREALSLLESEGHIYREDRRGWFISPSPLRYDPSVLMSFHQLAEQQSRRAETRIVEIKNTLANKDAAQQLKLAPFSDVHLIKRTRWLENRPVAFCINHIPAELAKNLQECPLEGSLNTLGMEYFGWQLGSVRYRIRSSSVVGDVAQALNATAGAAVLLVEKLTLKTDGTPANYALEYWRHDAISIESEREWM